MFTRRQAGAVQSPHARRNRAFKRHIRLALIFALAAGLTVPLSDAAAESSGSGGAPPTKNTAKPDARAKGSEPFSGRVVRRHIRRGGLVKFHAHSLATDAQAAADHRVITVKVRVRPDGARRWTTIERFSGLTRTVSTLRWRAKNPGRYEAQAVITIAGKTLVDSLGRFNVYRASYASWYGGGGRTACGQTLTDSIMGVAHKTLPCGTKVVFHLGNRTATARVIDRGPFVAGREWDLTPALRRAIGFGDVGTVYTTR